jgi:hypothetical protein
MIFKMYKTNVDFCKTLLMHKAKWQLYVNFTVTLRNFTFAINIPVSCDCHNKFLLLLHRALDGCCL